MRRGMTRREETRHDVVRAGGVLELARKLLGNCFEVADDADAGRPLGLDISRCASHDGQVSNDLSHFWFDDA